MRRVLSLLISIGAVVAASVAPAHAITGNFVDDNEHPYVGLVAFYDAAGEFSHRCSGALLDATTFLTAGHCTDGAESARVWFQQDAGANYDPATEHDSVSGYPDACADGTLGTLCATSDDLYNYGFDDFATFPDTHDVGLVILDQPIQVGEYGTLAPVGTLDTLFAQRRNDILFTASGYGLSYSSPVGVVSFRERLMAQGRLTNLNSANNDGFNIQTSGNGKGRGGTCSGDSGGPIFLGGFASNTIVAVTSFGMNAWCRGVDFSYRVDRQEVQDWIGAIQAANQAS